MLSVLQHFRESKQEQIFLGRDLGTVSGRILTEKASATATMIAEKFRGHA